MQTTTKSVKPYPGIKVLSLKKTVGKAADPWRGWGAGDGAAVPVSGVCASAASHLGTERLFCCWWVETCQRFAPDRVILERTSAFEGLFFLSAGKAPRRGRGLIVMIVLINVIHLYSITDKQTELVALTCRGVSWSVSFILYHINNLFHFPLRRFFF